MSPARRAQRGIQATDEHPNCASRIQPVGHPGQTVRTDASKLLSSEKLPQIWYFLRGSLSSQFMICPSSQHRSARRENLKGPLARRRVQVLNNIVAAHRKMGNGFRSGGFSKKLKESPGGEDRTALAGSEYRTDQRATTTVTTHAQGRPHNQGGSWNPNTIVDLTDCSRETSSVPAEWRAVNWEPDAIVGMGRSGVDTPTKNQSPINHVPKQGHELFRIYQHSGETGDSR
jgi:hypothetical protein